MFLYQLKFELFNSKIQSIPYIPNNIFESISEVEKNLNIKEGNNNKSRNNLSINTKEKELFDFRLGPISVEWIDMEDKIIDKVITNTEDNNNHSDNNDVNDSSFQLKNHENKELENKNNSLSNESIINENIINSNNNVNNNNNNSNDITINNNNNVDNISSEYSEPRPQPFFDFNSKNNNNNATSNSKSKSNNFLIGTSTTNNLHNNAFELERQQYIKINEKKIKKHGFIPVSGGFIPYSSLNTKYDIGILHLYRGIASNNSNSKNSNSVSDNYLIEDNENENSSDFNNTTNQSTPDESNKNLSEQPSSDLPPSYTNNIKKCKIVCVLAVPSHMSTIDFLNFVGPIRKYVSHFRIINDSLPNRFMVLMMFRKAKHAYDFVTNYNGIQFNSLEPETCHAVFIEKIEFQAKDLPSHLILFPDNPIAIEDLKKMEEERVKQQQQENVENASNSSNITDNINPPPSSSQDINQNENSHNSSSNSTSKSKNIIINTSNQNILSKTDQVELPICPVCLERMDASVTGLLTILCQHTFHCHCLSKWRGSTCPVCRYSQKSFLGNDQQNECSSCQSKENLWICLICGNIGCGRYQQAHAYQHFIETNHLYSLEIETQRVWDYAGDGYVHRLIQNKADGKLVELPSPGIINEDSQSSILYQQQQQQQQNQQQLANDMLAQLNNDKINFLSSEYNDLLTSQLESQKFYFENQMEDMKKVFNVQLQNLNDYYENINIEKCKEINELNEKLKYESNQNQNLEKEKNEYYLLMNNLLKEKKNMEKKIERSEILKKEYQEEKLLTKVLLENQNKLKSIVDEKDKEINDLREQVRDLMFYLDAKSKVESCEIKDEIQNGTIMISDESSSSGKKKKRSKNKRKK